ncbi:MAG: NADH-quinone oxidoreductase subunit M, partial [Ekhidna sp.]|nr:NADH-quinone oxidoreductase subunit M [Ekhidna sp.]
VSALIHAATMVAAGVYLLFRLSPFLHQDALIPIAVVGTVTALYGAICALFQNDIKKVLAYSTISQLGYMVMGVGVGAANAAFFHLFTHAFFKAGLFLGAGSIIHYMHQSTHDDPQDMRLMGGLRNQIPWTFRSFLVCGLALAGVPFFTGFMSKEGIIIGGWQWANEIGTWAYLIPDVALITALITALYVGKMLLLVFFGENRLAVELKKINEPRAMKVPLVLLAVGSLWFIFNLDPFAHHSWLGIFLDPSEETSAWVARIVMILSLIMTVSGLVLAYSFFKPGSSFSQNYASLDSRFKLGETGFYLTSVYQYLALSIEMIAIFLHRLDRRIIDGTIHFLGVGTVVVSKVLALADRFFIDGPVNLVGYLSKQIGRVLAGISSRDLQTQLLWLLVFVILILSWILLF